MLRLRSRLACQVLVGLLVIVFVSTPLGAQRFTCESDNWRYRYCRADVGRDRVEVVDEFSKRSCREGYSWGYDRRGVWVDRGCRASFQIVRSGGGSNTAGAAIAGAAIGAIIAGAIAAGKDKDRERGAPTWAIGTFDGYDQRYDSDVTLTITPSGSISAYSRYGDLRGRWIDGRDQIELDGILYDVEREGSGIRTIQAGGRREQISFRRMR